MAKLARRAGFRTQWGNPVGVRLSLPALLLQKDESMRYLLYDCIN